MAITVLTQADLIVRSSNNEPNLTQANTFATYAELEAEIRFRMDSGLWTRVNEDLHIRAAGSAYRDLIRQSWLNSGRDQSRDYEADLILSAPNSPPLGDQDFMVAIKRAQAAQVMFILAGTQVRDMARDGVRLHKNLSGSEMEFTGYRNAVCAEALEILARWIDLQPRLRRMQ